MTKSPTFPCEGGCACGAVRYRLLEDPLELHVCHCPNCQTVSGSAFVLCMPVHTRSLELLQGEPKLFSFRSPDGLAKRNRRCADCGACLWGEIAGIATRGLNDDAVQVPFVAEQIDKAPDPGRGVPGSQRLGFAAECPVEMLLRDIDSNGNAHGRLSIATNSDSWIRAPGPRQPFELRCSSGVR